jgi:hypothetical protein
VSSRRPRATAGTVVFFPEPTAPDDTPPGWDENPVDYLRRSTTPQAAAVRKFLNRALVCFPERHARSLVGKLRQDWQSFYFEIIVGRYLQVLGAAVEPDARGANGTDVDYRATFPDGVVVSVECVSKRYNEAADLEQRRNDNMVVMLDALGPHTWAIRIDTLPDARSADDFQPYVEAVAAFYRALPDAVEGGGRLPFEWDGDRGVLRLEAIPFPRGTMPNHLGPAVGWYDNSISRIKAALIDSHKRRQARGAHPPVFLAVDSPFLGPDADDFDQALFGQTVDHRGFDPQESVGVSFDPNGILVTDRDIPFAGVIAFLGLRMTTADDPILYLNPYQRWKLPAALAGHEQRVWASGIDRTPASRTPVIGEVGFTQYVADP